MADVKLPWVKLTTLTPREAYDWFRAKQVVPSFRWTDVWAQEHATAFTVAGLLRDDLLTLIHDKLGEAIAEGHDAAWFEKQLRPTLIAEGWWGKKEITDPVTGEVRTAQLGSPARLQLIYDVNLRSAYAAGRWQQAERTRRTAPYMMYRTMRDERVRKSHAEWDGLVLPINHPFWDQHYPPNGYRCRCIATSISEAGIQDLIAAGKRVKRTAPKETYTTYERDGERIKVPTGVDPGFDYNVGKERQRSLADYKGFRRAQLPEAIRSASERLDKKKPPK